MTVTPEEREQPARSDRAYAPTLRRSAPPEAAGYAAFAESVFANAEGRIPLKYRELIAVAVALTTQCEMCLESHVAAATERGATREEIAEASYVAAAIRAGGAFTHGMKAMRMLDHAGH